MIFEIKRGANATQHTRVGKGHVKNPFIKLSTFDAFKDMSTSLPGSIVMEGELLRRYQAEILHMAEDIVSVFESENITWHLTGGSALGAVRHHGFIPWDDDMDFDILGSDFDRFITAFRARYGDKYWVNTYDTPGYGAVIYSVRLKNSVYRGKDDVGKDHAGFRVDIIRIENAFDCLPLRMLHGILCMGMGFLLSCRNFFENRRFLLSLVTDTPSLRRVFLFKISVGALLSFLSVTNWTILTQKCYGFCRNDRSVYVTVPAGRKHYFGEMYLRSEFVESVEMDFAGHRWKVPAAYDKYLRHMYGDYEKLPPEEQREKHIILDLKFPPRSADSSIL